MAESSNLARSVQKGLLKETLLRYSGCMARSLALFVLCMAVSASYAQERDDAAARRIFADLNHERAVQHLPPLQWSNQLAASAAQHTEAMAKQDVLSHDLPGEPALGKRIADAGGRVSAFAENIALNSEGPDAIHEEWMHSPGHRTNMLNPAYDVVGIAAYRMGSRLYATEDFGTGMQASSADDADLKIQDAIAAERERLHLQKLSVMVTPGGAAAGCSAAPFASSNPITPGESRSVVNYTTSVPSVLPEALRKRIADSRYRRYALSVCEQRDALGFTLMSVHLVLFG